MLFLNPPPGDDARRPERALVPVQPGGPQPLRGRHGRLPAQQQPAGERQHAPLLLHHHGQPAGPADEGRPAAEDRSARVGVKRGAKGPNRDPHVGGDRFGI